MRVLNWILAGLSAVMIVGCDAATEAPPAEAVTAAPEVPVSPPLPKPLMRQAVHCCKNLTMEPVLRAYLALGVALADKDEAAGAASLVELNSSLSALNLDNDKKEALQKAVEGLDPGSIVDARKAYGAVSELLVDNVESSQAGVLDLALAYSRQADAHWFQEGAEPKSPYGDGINSYSWGSRHDVKEADEVREKELGHRP